MKKKAVSILLCLAVTMSMLAGCGNKAAEPEDSQADSAAQTEEVKETTDTKEAKGEKVSLKFYGKVIEYTSGAKMCDKLQEVMGENYNIEMLQVDWSNLDKVIRTGIASNEPCDVYCYAGQQMAAFENQAVDLTPYLDANGGEWRNSFDQALLDMCTVNGKILAIPWEANFPALIGNKKAFEDAGVTIPESWDYTEFMEACKKLQDAGYFPMATPMDLGQGGWLYRNAILSTTLEAGSYDKYISGELDFMGAETKEALDAVKSLYDAKYVYPGDGAVIAKKDEIQAGFLQGKVAMIANVAAGAKEMVSGASFEAVSVPWPTIGKTPALGGASANALFIPKNSANIEAAVEVIKAFTSEEVQSIHSEEGYLPANVNVEISDPFVKGLAAQSNSAYGFEFPATPAMLDYRDNNLMPDLILNGGTEVVQKSLEKLQKEYLSSK